MKTDLGYIRGAQGETGPKGETGAQGPAATIEVGSVTTSAYGTSPKVVNSGTESAARFDFTIPQGAPGETVADVSELTANFITESAASYPTYTTTEKMKVILGKIKKYLADLKSNAASLASKITAAEKNITNIQTDMGGITTALTGKLDKTDVIANLTATTSGKALDATQGKALQDQITQLNSESCAFTPSSNVSDVNINVYRKGNIVSLSLTFKTQVEIIAGSYNSILVGRVNEEILPKGYVNVFYMTQSKNITYAGRLTNNGELYLWCWGGTAILKGSAMMCSFSYISK